MKEIWVCDSCFKEFYGLLCMYNIKTTLRYENINSAFFLIFPTLPKPFEHEFFCWIQSLFCFSAFYRQNLTHCYWQNLWGENQIWLPFFFSSFHGKRGLSLRKAMGEMWMKELWIVCFWLPARLLWFGVVLATNWKFMNLKTVYNIIWHIFWLPKSSMPKLE